MRTGLSITTLTSEHTDMRCQSLRSMISPGRYVGVFLLFFFSSLCISEQLFSLLINYQLHTQQDNKDVLKLVLGKHNLTSPISSYSRPEVVTKSQSYFFTHSVKAITVTLTAKGITSKQLLIGTIGDQVCLSL